MRAERPVRRLSRFLVRPVLLLAVLSAVLLLFSGTGTGTGTGTGAGAGTTISKEVGTEVVDDMAFATAECVKVRDALEQAVASAVAPPAPVSAMQRRQMRGVARPQGDVDFPSYRRRYSMLQQKMESSIAQLRARLRALLAAKAPAMAHLAAVDAAMEKALEEHELRLLAGVPNLLEKRFQQLAQEGLPRGAKQNLPDSDANHTEISAQSQVPVSTLQAQLQKAAAKPALEPGPWLDTFRDDMRSVLLAELDLRLQPIEGLLSAIRTSQSLPKGLASHKNTPL